MERASRGILRYLLGAAEAVGDDEGLRRGVADGGEQDSVGEGLGDVVFVGFEAEGAGHAAAAGVEQGDVGSGAAEDGDLVGHAAGGTVMAVAVDDDLLGDLRRSPVRRELYQEFAEQISLVTELGGAWVVGEQVAKLVAEYRGAGGFEDDYWEAGFELGG